MVKHPHCELKVRMNGEVKERELRSNNYKLTGVHDVKNMLNNIR